MFWSHCKQVDQSKVSPEVIEKLQFYQLIGIPLPALILSLVCLKSRVSISNEFVDFSEFVFWKWISVWALFSGALSIYSFDFIWDSFLWKIKKFPPKQFWQYVAWGWFGISIIMWATLCFTLWKIFGWIELKHLLLRLFTNKTVQILMLSLFLYGLIIGVLKRIKWLMVIILPLVVVLSISFPIYTYGEFMKNDVVSASWQGENFDTIFPWSIFSLISMNVLLVQRFEMPKDRALRNYNVWIDHPRFATLFWWGMVVLFIAVTIYKLNHSFLDVKWGECAIAFVYLALLWQTESQNVGRIKSNFLTWIQDSGYRFLIDLMLLGMVLP